MSNTVFGKIPDLPDNTLVKTSDLFSVYDGLDEATDFLDDWINKKMRELGISDFDEAIEQSHDLCNAFHLLDILEVTWALVEHHTAKVLVSDAQGA